VLALLMSSYSQYLTAGGNQKQSRPSWGLPFGLSIAFQGIRPQDFPNIHNND
jgi:hypothetical protein